MLGLWRADRRKHRLFVVLVALVLQAPVSRSVASAFVPLIVPRRAGCAVAIQQDPFIRLKPTFSRQSRVPVQRMCNADTMDEGILIDEEEDAACSVEPGVVYIVATPIGNLQDITLRALNVLRGVDIVASEDTRRTGRLLKHFEISKPQVSHHEHNWRTRAPELVSLAQEGKSIAVVSDAGTPGVADPGTELVEACVASGVRVEAVPGACAAVAAVSASGLARAGFTFAGFMPPKGEKRRRAMAEALSGEMAAVLYEAPHRLAGLLREMEALGNGARRIVVARELTKRHEQVWRGSVAEASLEFGGEGRGSKGGGARGGSPTKGEFTLVVEGGEGGRGGTGGVTMEDGGEELLRTLMELGVKGSVASRAVAKALGVSPNRLKKIAMADGGSKGSEAEHGQREVE